MKHKHLALALIATLILSSCAAAPAATAIPTVAAPPAQTTAAPVAAATAAPAETTSVSATVLAAGPNRNGFYDISVEQLEALLAEEDIWLVNVHIPYEGEIAGTDAHIDYREITQNLDQLPPDPATPLVLYCRSGSMSTTSGQALAAAGYTSVFELDGGMGAWQRAGNDLVYTR